MEIARWCGENDVVWMTLDRGILKDREIAAAIVRWRTSILLLPVKGMRMRDHLALLVSRFDRIEQAVERERARGRAFRFRMTKRGSMKTSRFRSETPERYGSAEMAASPPSTRDRARRRAILGDAAPRAVLRASGRSGTMVGWTIRRRRSSSWRRCST